MSYTSARLRNISLYRTGGGLTDADKQLIAEVADLVDNKNVELVLPYMVRDQPESLRVGLHELDNQEMGKVIAIALGVLVARGINLRTFLPNLAMTVLDDEELQRNLQRLGEL